MSDATDTAEPSTVSWRDYMRVCIARETGVILAKLDAINERNTSQVAEVARRLEDLNHAHRKAVEDRAQFVNKDIFERAQQEDRRFHEYVGTMLAERKGRDATTAAIAAVGGSVLVGLVLLLGAWLLGLR